MWSLAALPAWGAVAGVELAPPALPQLPSIVVESTPIPGSSLDIDKIPGNVQTLSAADLSRSGSASLTDAMNSGLASINVNDNLDDPFQPDILYRGFEASPVLGTPQGLAVYQNGVRINEAFGDTVNWDLFPDIAIDRVELVSSSPVYGLNALGGAISVSMKNGFKYQGSELELSGGSFGQRSAALQYGVSADHVALYVAGRALDQTGWRMFSDDVVRQLYAVLSARSERASIELSYTRADNQLNGQGAAPVQELQLSRGLVFTGPQHNFNRLGFLTLNGSLNITDTSALQSVLYYRQYRQTVANGNTTNDQSCTVAQYAGDLCQAGGVTPLTDAAGGILPDISRGATIPIGENDFEATGAYGRGAALQITDSARIFDHENQFAAGATLDDALVSFHSGAQIGLIDPELTVLPSNLIVNTTEAQQNAALAAGDQNVSAQPVSLQGMNRDYGLYATDTFDLTRALSLTASGRYNIANIDLHDLLGSNLTGNNRYTHFNPAIGGTYKLLPATTVYAGVSQSTRTPTASEIECSNPLQPCLLPSNLAGDPPSLRQVVARTAELGLRGNFLGGAGAGKRGSWNLSLFRTDLHDDIDAIATSVSQGFFQNIGDTRRQGIEAGLKYQAGPWSAYLNYSYVDATFESALTLPSPSNPFHDVNGDIQVQPGDRLPGIPQHRLKAGADFDVQPGWTLGATLLVVSDQTYFGDESNQNAPMSGYHVVGLHCSYRIGRSMQVFATVRNLLNAKYATYGTFGDPTGVGAPGIPAGAVANGPGVDDRFQSPAAPTSVYVGVRVTL